MTIGCGGVWHKVLGGMLHESLEFLLHRKRMAYEHTCSMSEDSGRYMFVMSHSEMDEIVKDVGYFISSVLPLLKKEYDSNKRKEAKA